MSVHIPNPLNFRDFSLMGNCTEASRWHIWLTECELGSRWLESRVRPTSSCRVVRLAMPSPGGRNLGRHCRQDLARWLVLADRYKVRSKVSDGFLGLRCYSDGSRTLCKNRRYDRRHGTVLTWLGLEYGKLQGFHQNYQRKIPRRDREEMHVKDPPQTVAMEVFWLMGSWVGRKKMITCNIGVTIHRSCGIAKVGSGTRKRGLIIVGYLQGIKGILSVRPMGQQNFGPPWEEFYAGTLYYFLIITNDWWVPVERTFIGGLFRTAFTGFISGVGYLGDHSHSLFKSFTAMADEVTGLMENLKFSEEELIDAQFEGENMMEDIEGSEKWIVDRPTDFKGPFQFGEWLKVDLGKGKLSLRRKPVIVYAGNEPERSLREGSGEQSLASQGREHRSGTQMEKVKGTGSSSSRLRTSKRSLMGRNEVCNPIAPKKSRTVNITVGEDDVILEATSPIKIYIPKVEAGSQPRREP
ncbi:hypothetical protein V6N13_049190 [Hibiscus sabdariffa]